MALSSRRSPSTLLFLLLLLVVGLVSAQRDDLLSGLNARQRAVMETVIESMEMRERVDGEIKDLKKEFEKELDQQTAPVSSQTSEEAQTEARVAEACKAHASALHSLSLLPPPPTTPIPSQTFMTLASPSSSSPSNSFIVNWIQSLRRRFWKEGYGDSARLPGNGRPGGGGAEKRRSKEGGGSKEEVRGRAAKVLGLLEVATEWGCDEAWGTRGRVAMFPPPPLQQNLSLAFEAYSEHARLTGNATAHYILGFFHATGYGETVPIDQGKALLHCTFAALQSHPAAEHALAYKYWAGIGVEEDCMTAMGWYETAAERVFAHFLSGPPGGRTMPPTTTKLSDLDGGAYGVGASWASTGMNVNRATVKAGLARAGGETWEDILDYYNYQSDRGALEHIVKLGRIHYFGSIYQVPGGIASGPEGVGLVTQSFAIASHHFHRVARQVWPSDKPNAGRLKTRSGKDVQFPNDLLSYAGVSAGFLGRMALRGEAQKIDFKRAKMWFERGAEMGERESYNGLGIIYRDGLGVSVDGVKAQEFFQAAADQDLAEAHVNLGKLALARGEIHPSTHSFHQAVRVGSPFEAFYQLGKVYAASARAQAAAGLRPETCGPAVAHLKLVVERGSWKDDVVGEADRAWERGETDKAIVGWWMAGERGYESAQNNLAFVLDQDPPLYSLPWRSYPPDKVTAQFALNHWLRSAAQDNVDSLVKVGDYHFKGIDGSGEPQYEKAAGFYQAAAERQTSAIALWNLGYMYENGLGVPQDWHLAKRNYDLALETNPEASLPVNLALIKLYARSIYASLTGGPQKSLSLWRPNHGATPHSEDAWTIGNVKDGFKKRWAERDGVEGGAEGAEPTAVAEEPGGWAEGRDAEEEGRDFDGADWIGMNGEREEYDDEEETWVETILLLALCGLVAVFSWLRGRWTRQRQEELARRQALAAVQQNGQDQEQQQPQQPPPPPPANQPIDGPPWPPMV
ncbi:hypothetical protein BDY24DRAFT_388595 [Mrakia frigida]|uniref:ubiquitin ligase complex subunit HRD3 n=1 Tax=Mrakia frigida TaxID=29902 RepID=UPI003FCC2493